MAFGDIIRSAASPSDIPTGIGGDASTIWHCDLRLERFYELSTTDFSISRSTAKGEPYGSGGASDVIWFCRKTAIRRVQELSTTDLSTIRSEASPGSSPYGIGGASDVIWHSDTTAYRIYELSTTDFSVIREAASFDVTPTGIGGTSSTIWHCSSGSNKVFELSTTDFSVIRSVTFADAGLLGIGGDANTIWGCGGADLIYELDAAVVVTYPSDPATRITELVHRYTSQNVKHPFTLEVLLGGATLQSLSVLSTEPPTPPELTPEPASIAMQTLQDALRAMLEEAGLLAPSEIPYFTGLWDPDTGQEIWWLPGGAFELRDPEEQPPRGGGGGGPAIPI